MVLHEFATNAAKHGALSTAAGRVALTARVENREVLMAWTETGGPAVEAPPTRRGTGRSVVQAQTRRLGGVLTYDWRPEGLRVELQVPLERWIG
jgi:two-component sensor histidine kinase